MQEKTIISNFIKEYYDMFNSCYKSYCALKDSKSSSNELEECLSQYQIFKKYETRVRESKSITDIETIYNSILVDINNIKALYDKEFSEWKDLSQRHTNHSILNEKTKKINAIVKKYSDILAFSKLFKKYIYMKSITSIEKTTEEVKTPRPLPQEGIEKRDKTIVVKSEEKDKSKITTQSHVKIDRSFYLKDRDVIGIASTNKMICDLKDKYYKLEDHNSEEAIEISKKLYQLCTFRESMLEKISGFDGVNLCSNIESVEDASFSSKEFTPKKSYQVDANGYTSLLITTLHNINEMRFEEKSGEEYDSLLRDYNNMVKSLFGNDKEISSMSKDLISCFSLFNLSGGYAAFKGKHKEGKIGSEKINPQMYREGIDRINTLLSKFSTLSEKKINQIGGIIVISNHEKTRSQKIADLNQMYYQIYDKIVASKEATLSMRQ